MGNSSILKLPVEIVHSHCCVLYECNILSILAVVDGTFWVVSSFLAVTNSAAMNILEQVFCTYFCGISVGLQIHSAFLGSALADIHCEIVFQSDLHQFILVLAIVGSFNIVVSFTTMLSPVLSVLYSYFHIFTGSSHLSF